MTSPDPLFFLVAGEASGDYLGARLMQALKIETGRRVRFAGIGGPRMQAEGLDLLFPQTELAHMGVFELFVHLPRLARRLRQTVRAVETLSPAALITIDSPDFSFRVAKRLKKSGVPLIHYVAPTVWAWRPGRAKKIAAFLDHLLALLPFEPPYFTVHGLDCTFVGHPVLESGAGKGDGARFRAKYAVCDAAVLLAVLPGSRRGEVGRLLPVLRETVLLLKEKIPALQLVIPLVPGVADRIEKEARTWPVPVHFVRDDADKYDAFAASSAALACSGTVSVELALAGVPTAIAYKVGKLTAMLSRRLVKTKYATLLNIMNDRAVMPEFLQEECTSKKLCEAVIGLLTDEATRRTQKDAFASLSAWLGRDQFVPSEKAAQTVLAVVARKRVGK